MSFNTIKGLDKNKFSGSWVALVTPMSVDGIIDYACLRELIEWHIQSGTHGLVMMGTTGESSLVSIEEHVEVVKVALEYSNKRIPIIAGCGSAATFKVIDLVKKLNPLKPDGYLCVTPYYIKPSQDGLISHFKAVADICDAPLILYNVPSRTACDLANDSVIELAQHENIIGIKDAVGNIERAVDLFKKLDKEFVYLSGDDETAFDFVVQGGDGVISVTANIAPAPMSLWCEKLLSNRFTKQVSEQEINDARQVFNQLMPLHKKLFVEANPIPLKWALNFIKKIPAGIRSPLTLPSLQSQNEIAEAINQSIKL